MERFSRQREAIRCCLSERKDHPTADELYGLLKNDMPNLSLATVYRNLSYMLDAGEIRKLVCEGDSSVHFDFNTAPHSHFFCRKCGAIRDVPPLCGDGQRSEVEERMHVSVDEVSISYYGLCGSCREEAGKSPH